MSSEFEEFIHEDSQRREYRVSNRVSDRVSKESTLLLMMTSSFSSRRRSSRRLFSEREEFSNLKKKQKKDFSSNQDQDLSKSSNEELLIDVDFYSKISYNRDVVVILLIKSRKDLDLYSRIQSENVTTAFAIYQLLFERRKKNYVNEAKRYLNSKNSHFIDQSLDRFRR
jgi:hypothetical protein